jgi:hypothetical protein
MSQYDLSAATNTNLTTGADMLKSSKKRKGKSKGKNKNNNDDVNELNIGGPNTTDYNNTSDMGTTNINDTHEPLKKKKKKKRDKNKGKQDDLVSMGGSGPKKSGPVDHDEEYIMDVEGNPGG